MAGHPVEINTSLAAKMWPPDSFCLDLEMSNQQRLSVQQVLNILQDSPSDQSDIEGDGETDVQFDYTVDDVDSDDTYHVDSESNNDSSEVKIWYF